jgi:hypothetical protein
MLGQYDFAEPNQHVWTFLHPKFGVQCYGGLVLKVLGYKSKSTHMQDVGLYQYLPHLIVSLLATHTDEIS